MGSLLTRESLVLPAFPGVHVQRTILNQQPWLFLLLLTVLGCGGPEGLAPAEEGAPPVAEAQAALNTVSALTPASGSVLTGVMSPGPQAQASTTVAATQMVFTLKDSSGQVVHTRTEMAAPYCLQGDDQGTCRSWDTRALADGGYTLTATATFADGTTASRSTSFTLLNVVPEPVVVAREQVSLNGTWPVGGTVPRYDSQNVTFATRTYERQVSVPATWTGKRIKLEFNAVNYDCDVYVNNTLVRSHTGAWVPFDVDVTSRVTPGQSFTLRLEVRGQLQPPTMVNGEVVWWIGHNDLNGARSGIVDDVWMRAYGGVHIEDAFINPSFRQKTLTVTYTLVNRASGTWTGHLVGAAHLASDDTKAHSFATTVQLAPGERRTVTLTTGWADAQLWWPDQPTLYFLKSALVAAAGQVTDQEVRRFGFREFWIEGTQFRLNGIRVNLRGDWACYTQYWGSISSPAVLRTNYDAMRRTNANILRWHKHPAPRFAYEMADELGIMILAETAFYGRSYLGTIDQEAFVANMLQLIPAFVRGLRNNPSVVMWSASNEVTFSDLGKFAPTLVKQVGDAIYSHDPSRPVSYDGDTSVPGVIHNRHYPEGYENDPIGNPYTAWSGYIHATKPTYFGEMLAVRPATNDNGWWIGVWPRGLRYLNVAGIAPRVYYNDNRITAAQAELQRAAYNPVALFDKQYDQLGIAPFLAGTLPTLDEGSAVTRALVLYNDDYRDSAVTARVDVRVDGIQYATGQRTYTLAPGERRDVPADLQVPFQGGKTVEVVLSTYKAGVKRFEEKKRFTVRDTGVSGTSSATVTLR